MGGSDVMLVAAALVTALAAVALFLAGGARQRLQEIRRRFSPSRHRQDQRVPEDEWRKHQQTFPEFHAGREVFSVKRRPVVGTLSPQRLDPVQARRANLRMVVDAFDASGVEYFAIRRPDPSKSAVAVPESARDEATSVLADLLRTTGGYMQVVRNDDEGNSPPMPGTASVDLADEPHSVLRVFWYRRNTAGTRTFGARYGCDLEFWSGSGDGTLAPPRRNPVVDGVAAESEVTAAPDSILLPWAPHPEFPDGFSVRTVAPFDRRIVGDVLFPIDAVFTWVDGEDPRWQERKAAYVDAGYHEEADNSSRYIARDELRYALRSIEMFAPWIRNIFLVTDRQVPSWLRHDVPGLRVVDHTEIFADPDALPTFNSHAIESQLHHIDGLAEHFLYLNDDFMFGTDVVPQDFFEGNGLTRFFPSRYSVPAGPPTPDDPPVVAAAKNNRDALAAQFGTTIVRRLKHTPYAVRRSVLYEIEDQFGDLHRRTAHAKTRSITDLSILSSFYQFYAYARGLAVPGRIRYRYVDLGEPEAEERLAEIARERVHQAICLNTKSAGYRISATDFEAFLGKYFNTPSRFEV